MISTLTKQDTSILIDGPAGKLQIMLEEAIGKEREALGIVCHPHPLHGGNMNNKVVTTLAKTFQQLGLLTIRFNFRGVGKSEGQFANGEGELEDLLSVINWIRKQQGNHGIWLAGFSFGSYIAAKAATEMPIKKLVTVAPPVQHFPMQDLPPITCPWILVQGDLDEIVPPHAVYTWADSRNPKPHIMRFSQAGHFFHGQLIELRERLIEMLQKI